MKVDNTVTVTPEAPVEDVPARRNWIKYALREGGSFIPFIVLVIVAIIIVPGFLSQANLQNLLTQNVTIGVVAAGMTLVIVSGAFDLSVGAIFAFSSVLWAVLTVQEVPLFVGGVITLFACLLLGIANGILVTVFRINSFVATLGSSLAIGGLALIVASNKPIFVDNPDFRILGGTQGLFGIPWSAWILVVITVIAGLVLARTVFGLHISAMGANKRAAQLVGIRTALVQTGAFALLAALAGLAGMISASQLSSATGAVGGTLALDAIAAVVIGGTSLTGGRGSVLRTFVGVLILGILTNIFNTFGWDSSVQLVVKGAVVVFAVAFDALKGRDRS